MRLTVPIKLGTRIGVLAATRSSDGAGGWTQTWAETGHVQGEVAVPRTRRDEQVIAGKPEGRERAEFTLRDPQGLVRLDRRLTAGGLQYEVLSVMRQTPFVIVEAALA